MAEPLIITEKNLEYRKWLMSYFKRSWWRIAVLVFLSLFSIVALLLNPWPLKLLADSVFGDIAAPSILEPFTGTKELLFIIGGIYIALYFFQGFSDFLYSYVSARFGLRLTAKIKTQFFRHVLHIPLGSSERLQTSDYVYRQNVETNSVAEIILNTTVTIFRSLFSIFGAFAVLMFLDWQMTLISLAVVPFLYLSVWYFGKKLEQRSFSVEETYSDIYNHTAESIDHSAIVQSFNRQKKQVALLEKKFVELFKKEMKRLVTSNEFSFVNTFLNIFAITVIVVLGGLRVFSGDLSFGDLLIFVTYAGQLYDPLQTLSYSIGSLRESNARIRRVYEVISQDRDIENIESGKILENVKGTIEFKNVSFSFKDKKILKDVSFTVKAGEKVAFIGPSGAGKSTLLNLLSRFSEPDLGFIYLDGQELSKINLESLRNNISLVGQEPELFSLSIAENIAFSNPDEKYPMPLIMGAAKGSFATEFIDKLPEKYNSMVKNSGDNLSGGQKQRIAIARAFFKNSPVLILDEPTSAQDVASETKVLDGINKLMQGKTVLMVTHKHSLLAQVDKIFVVDVGKVIPVEKYGGLDAYERYLNIHEL